MPCEFPQGILPGDGLFFLGGLVQDLEQRFVFLTAFGADIQVFADDRHDLSCVLLVDLTVDVLIQPGKEFFAVDLLIRHGFQDVDDPYHRFLRKLLLQAKTRTDAFDNIWYFHNSAFQMVNEPLILLLFKKCKDFVRGNVLHGQPALETQAGVVQKLVEGITVGL